MGSTDNEKKVMAKPLSVTLALVQVTTQGKNQYNDKSRQRMAGRPSSGDDINARNPADVTDITSNDYYQDSVPITVMIQ